jgi:hypothetical protein
MGVWQEGLGEGMTLDFLPWGDAVGFLGSERVGSPPVLPLCQIRDNLSGICNRRCCASTSVVCSTSPGPCRSPGPLVYLADGEVTRGLILLTTHRNHFQQLSKTSNLLTNASLTMSENATSKPELSAHDSSSPSSSHSFSSSSS